MFVKVSGTEGYAHEAESLIRRWQSISFADQHSQVVHLLPDAPSRVLDIGAGIGTDAAALAAMGHTVVAVEPVGELRTAAINLHRSSRIEWIDDSLPDLRIITSMNETFDVVMLTAVWMHLDYEQRCRAMPHKFSSARRWRVDHVAASWARSTRSTHVRRGARRNHRACTRCGFASRALCCHPVDPTDKPQ